MIDWPDLPSAGFVSGRPATETDFDRGDAVFHQAGTSLGALDVHIPQYAFWTDENAKKHPAIVSQAELASDGTEVFGLYTLDGLKMVATAPELTLIGMEKPTL